MFLLPAPLVAMIWNVGGGCHLQVVGACCCCAIRPEKLPNLLGNSPLCLGPLAWSYVSLVYMWASAWQLSSGGSSLAQPALGSLRFIMAVSLVNVLRMSDGSHAQMAN
eukprot:jgi/Mesvir1/24483/Mv25991-RA.1